MPRTFAHRKLQLKKPAEMDYILHIDTSGDKGVVAISGNGKLLAVRINTDTRNHAAVINNLTNEIVSEAGIKLKDILAIAVCGGPGSYTGLRIGLSTAKALCYTMDIPLLHHDRLLLLALSELHNNLNECNLIATILPAREQEYFIGIYNDKYLNVLDPRHIFQSELNSIFDEYGKNIVLVGKISNKTDVNEFLIAKYTERDEIDLNYWSKYAYKSYVEKNFADIALSEPFYLKQVYTHK